MLKSGTYRITAHMRKIWNGGNAKFAVDGKPQDPTFGGYDDWGRAYDVSLGPVELAAGDHELTIEVTGKGEKSQGYLIDVDSLWLSVPR